MINQIISLKAYAKINLYLKIIRKLNNNYHEIQTLFGFCNIYDQINVYKNDKNSVIFKGPFSKGIKKNNTIYKLLNILNKNKIINLKIEVIKNIPQGSGMGGASSNAAAVLNFINSFYKFNLNKKKIKHISNKIGADVYPCINTKLKYFKSNKLIEINKKIKSNILLIYPNYKNSTKTIYNLNHVYSKKRNNLIFLKKNISNSYKFYKFLNFEGNDLESAAFKSNKKTLELLSFLKQLKGCAYASMTGSGSACFVFFNNDKHLTSAIFILKKRYKTYWIKKTKIL
jgi:4-diphosphocytidyl-2-C-methyl-D-erythritol kinase